MFKEIVEDYREFWAWLKDWSFYKRQSVKMSLAIRLADIKQRAFNRQFHIMLLELPSGEKLVSVTRDDVERLKRNRCLPKNMSFFDLKHGNSVFYSTPLDRNNKSSAEERKDAVAKYLKYSRRLMK